MEKLGYVKLFRELMQEGIFEDKDLWRLYTWCLMKASHQERNTVIEKQIVHLKPGQFIYGRHRAAEQLNEKEYNIKNWMPKLKELGLISIEAKNKFSIVTITDWHLQTEDQKKNRKKPAKGQQEDTDNNVNNLNNVKADMAKDLADEFRRMSGGTV